MSDNLYIQIANGAPVNHPAFESNLIDALGAVPSDWAPFTRIKSSDSGVTLGIYQTYVRSYVLGSDGVTWQDSFTAGPMDSDAIAQKQTTYQTAWNNQQFVSNFSAWTFDADTCQMVPPTTRPTNAPSGQQYRWQGSSNSWQLTPSNPPADGNTYIWDFNNWAFTATNVTTST
jgi:hypothetical protein